MTCMCEAISVLLSGADGDGQQRDGARLLDRERHLALVERTVAADATGNDLAALRHEVLERLRVLVVDDQRLVGAEAANPLASHPATAGRVRVQIRRAAEVAVVVEGGAAATHA